MCKTDPARVGFEFGIVMSRNASAAEQRGITAPLHRWGEQGALAGDTSSEGNDVP